MFRLLFSLIILALGFHAGITYADEKQIAGWVERVILLPGDLALYARMNPGADRSSLYVASIEESQREGHTWVKFVVLSRFGQKSTIEKEVSKVVLVKDKAGELERRFKVVLRFCMGSSQLEGEVMLVKRDQFAQHVEFGRGLLAAHVLIDPSQSYTTEPECKGTHS